MNAPRKWRSSTSLAHDAARSLSRPRSKPIRRESRFRSRGPTACPRLSGCCADKHFVGQVLVNLDHQLDPLRQGGGCDARSISATCWTRSSSRSRTTASGISQGGRAPCLRAVLPYGQGPFARAGRYGARTGDRQAYHRSARRANQRAQRAGSGNVPSRLRSKRLKQDILTNFA